MLYLTRLIHSWLKRPCPQCRKPTAKLVEDIELNWVCPACAEKHREWDERMYLFDYGRE